MNFTVAYNMDMRTENTGWIFQNNNGDHNLKTETIEANTPDDAIALTISKLMAELQENGAIITAKNLNNSNSIEFRFCGMDYRASNFRALGLI